MEEFTTNVAFDSFADMPEFYGEGRASYRLAMVKHRDDFLDLFEGAAHVDAVTYGQSPSLMVQMLREYDVGSFDVLVGNADDFEDEVDEVATAKELVAPHEDDRLTIRLKNQKIVHTKLYRIVTPDGRVKLTHGFSNRLLQIIPNDVGQRGPMLSPPNRDRGDTEELPNSIYNVLAR
jgi:hypothetical protein